MTRSVLERCVAIADSYLNLKDLCVETTFNEIIMSRAVVGNSKAITTYPRLCVQDWKETKTDCQTDQHMELMMDEQRKYLEKSGADYESKTIFKMIT